MDKIILKGLEIYAYHGVSDSERELGQRFILDIEMLADLRPAGETDDLALTVNYALVYADVQTVFTERPFRLLEAAAEAVAAKILAGHAPVREVVVRVKKPSAPIPGHLAYAAVEIRRGR
ncbi:dihydroneopterin aldolase [Desulforudis sp. 1088]|jgi:dihydroneopterin aldolase|uniref:dihydroneopterin aldolase n=1 Tax=unclassified Candidatus Desulforudis TaxID=2635950 RepID=UPI003475D48A